MIDHHLTIARYHIVDAATSWDDDDSVAAMTHLIDALRSITTAMQDIIQEDQ